MSTSAMVRAEAARFDDSSLEHLANKGLVRRAKKLIGEEATVEDTSDGCTVAGDGWTVVFVAGRPLPDAACACSTAGVCQHLIAAIMTLRDRAESDAPGEGGGKVDGGADSRVAVDQNRQDQADDIRQAIFALTDEDFLAWTKMADARWAAARVESTPADEVVIEAGRFLRVDLPAPHGSVNFMADDLDRAIVKPSGRHDRRTVALAVLMLWNQEGRTFAPPAPRRAAPINELSTERRAVVQRATRLTSDLLTMGLLHLADPEAERIGSLGASLRGVKLYRLATLADRAADQIDALADLSATADTARLLDQLAELAVVAEATRSRLDAGIPLPEGLVGVARNSYDSVGHLELVGLGHYSWGDERFAGSTAVVAESANRIYSVSSPTHANGRSISTSGWSGTGSAFAVAGQRFALANAQASGSLRLSPTEKSTASVVGDTRTDDLASLAWDGSAPSRGSRLLGAPSTVWAVLRVDAELEAVSFDSIEQELVWTITSAAQSVRVRLPFGPHAEQSLTTMETTLAQRGSPSYVVGRLRGSAAGLELWPISLMTKRGFVNLASAPSPSSGRKQKRRSVPDGVSIAPVARTEPLERFSIELLRLAEGGARASRPEARERLANAASAAGFEVLAKILVATDDAPSSLIRAAWLLMVSRDLVA